MKLSDARSWKDLHGCHLSRDEFETTERTADKVVFWVCAVLMVALIAFDVVELLK